jgi:transcriptional repressor NrdR
MHCPFCGSSDTKVLETRLTENGASIKRRRSCNACNKRYSTREVAELEMPRVIKSSGVSEIFNEEKLKSGFIKALEKRPVATDAINTSISKIKQHLSTMNEVQSSDIGILVMEELKCIDDVAYIRFASVYRKFKDIEAFKEEIEKLIAK